MIFIIVWLFFLLFERERKWGSTPVFGGVATCDARKSSIVVYCDNGVIAGNGRRCDSIGDDVR
jgi:hypothetical protein